jgi:amidase
VSLQEAIARGTHLRPFDSSPMMKLMQFLGEYMRRHYQNKFYSMSRNLVLTLTEAYNEALRKYDVLIMPTVPFLATKLPSNEDSLDGEHTGNRV